MSPNDLLNPSLPCDLTQAEIDEICAPLKQPAAQIRFLKDRLKVPVTRRPNGRPLVSRLAYINVRGAVTTKR